MGRKNRGFAGFLDPAGPGKGAPRFATNSPKRSFCSNSGRGGLAGARHSPQDTSAKGRARLRRYSSPSSEGEVRWGWRAARRTSPQGDSAGSPIHPHPLRCAPGLPPLKRGKDIHCGVKAFCNGIPWDFSAKSRAHQHRCSSPSSEGEARWGWRGAHTHSGSRFAPRRLRRQSYTPPSPALRSGTSPSEEGEGYPLWREGVLQRHPLGFLCERPRASAA